MTQVKVYTNDTGQYSIEVTGHNRSKRICAAISALVAALSGWCENFDNGFQYYENDGVSRMLISKEATDVVMSFYIGVKRLELMYPRNVSVDDNL